MFTAINLPRGIRIRALCSLVAAAIPIIATAQETGSSPRAVRPTEQDIDFQQLPELFSHDEVPCRFPPFEPWQKNEACGLNCVYLLLHLTGHPVNYKQLSAAAGPMPKGGLSLEQMKQLCSQFGLACDVVYGDPARSLARAQAPLVLHLGDANKPGHYICLFDKQDSPPAYSFVDGSTGIELEVREDRGQSLDVVSRVASGYMLVPSQAWSGRLVRAGGIALWLAVAVVWGELAIRRIASARRRRAREKYGP